MLLNNSETSVQSTKNAYFYLLPIPIIKQTKIVNHDLNSKMIFCVVTKYSPQSKLMIM